MRLKRLGHATLLVETGSTRMLIDPGVYSSDWHEVTKLAAILITHEHPDHFDLENIARLANANPGSRIMAPSSVCDPLATQGISGQIVESGETWVVGDITLEMVGGLHALVHADIPQISNVGVVMQEPAGPRVFHPGDEFDSIPPGIDLLALPLTAPWSTAASTVDFLRAVEPEIAFPIHDAGLSETGVATFMRLVGRLAPKGTQLIPLGGTESLKL